MMKTHTNNDKPLFLVPETSLQPSKEKQCKGLARAAASSMALSALDFLAASILSLFSKNIPKCERKGHAHPNYLPSL